MGTKRVFHSLNMEFCAILSVSGGGSLRLKYSGQWVLKVKYEPVFVFEERTKRATYPDVPV